MAEHADQAAADNKPGAAGTDDGRVVDAEFNEVHDEERQRG
jgi:hypothetical protein